MNIVTIFDPSAQTSGSFNATFPNGAGKMLLINESNVNITISWLGYTSYVPAGDRRFYCIHSNSALVEWSQQSVLPGSNSNTPSQIVVEAYAPGEPIIETYPAPLVRSTTIGNTVTTTGGNATELINIGNNPGTPVFDVQTSGDPTASTMSNNNVWSIGSLLYPGSYSFLNGRYLLNTTGLNLSNCSLLLTNGSLLSHVGVSSGATVFSAAPGIQTIAALLTNSGALTLGNAAGSDGLLNILSSGITTLGSNGFIAVYPFMQGTIKICFLWWSGYGNASNQDVALPTAFLEGALFWTGETQGGSITFRSSGSNVTCSVLTALSGTGGSQTPETAIKAWTQGQTRGGFDTLRFLFNSGTNAGGFALIIGI